MRDLSKGDPRLLDDVDMVVGELRARIGIVDDRLMLVGARCRDVLHSALGYEAEIGVTDDTDLAIALTDWQTYDRIAATFESRGDSGICFLVDGIKVDIMPFGSVEDPKGQVTPRARGEDMVVFGFEDVFSRSRELSLPTAGRIRIPTIAGYTALKLRAWIDRAAYGQNKDGKDLAAAIFWYGESPDVHERLFDTDDGLALLERLDWDRDLGSAFLLGVDVREELSTANGVDLSARWRATDRDLLSRSLTLPSGYDWSAERPRRLALIDSVLSGLTLGLEDQSAA
ncbi:MULTISPECIES: hypothetical protein [Microbacterium]|uniref:hypothetical protein n=1 Tax=Microbacterium TaxID=33882 RepID=UPI001CC10DBD|nr:hypothetical protein [Microbacterium sp. OVT16B]